MPLESDARIALQAARAAGQAALAERRAREQRKADGSPVSAADHAADAAISAVLEAAFPQDMLLSEEHAADAQRLQADRVWIIDPIDGTRAFLDGRAEWSVHVALCLHGQLALGVVGLPEEDLWLVGILGQGCYHVHGENWMLVQAPTQAEQRLLLSRRLARTPAGATIRERLPQYAIGHRSSVGGKVAELLAGRACHYAHPLLLQEWDVAAPAAVLLAAGGLVSALGPGALIMNQPDVRRPRGFVFSLPGYDHDQVLASFQDWPYAD